MRRIAVFSALAAVLGIVALAQVQDNPTTETQGPLATTTYVTNNKVAWDSSVSLGSTAVGLFTNNVTGLDADTLYYYRCYASNIVDEAWASPSTNFTTLPLLTTKYMERYRVNGRRLLIAVPQ
jgi:hypothetical protein